MNRILPSLIALCCLIGLALFSPIAPPLKASVDLAARKGAGATPSYTLRVKGERVDAVARKIARVTGRVVEVVSGGSTPVTFAVVDVAPEALIEALRSSAGLRLTFAGSTAVLGEAEPAVTLDVKDVDVRKILLSMKEQCGIRNLMIDPDVRGEGTFLFKRVPCTTAFDVVTRTMGLSGAVTGNVAHIELRK